MSHQQCDCNVCKANFELKKRAEAKMKLYDALPAHIRDSISDVGNSLEDLVRLYAEHVLVKQIPSTWR